MNIDLMRGSFVDLAGAGAGSTTLGAMGFGAALAAEVAHVRAFRLTATTETRNICTYCSVACGIILYSKGDLAASETAEPIHVEGDADHPTNRGTLCPKGSALKGFVRSETRAVKPRYRAPGGTEWQDITWDAAFDKIARALKDDRDANFIGTNDQGQTVNRWRTAGFLAASGGSNETGRLTYKTVRSLGILPFDNQARV